jgi:hypothetical protein
MTTEPEKCISPIDEERNCLYDMRMSEFYYNYLNNNFNQRTTSTNENMSNLSVLQRPKCSISPINHQLSLPEPQNDSYLSASNLIHASYISSCQHQLSLLNPCDSGYQSIYECQSTNNNPLTSVTSLSANSKSQCISSPFVNQKILAPLTNKHLMIKQSIDRFQSTPTKPLDSTLGELPESVFVQNQKTTDQEIITQNKSKKKVNFHNIHELAQSSNESLKWNISDIPLVTLNQNTSSEASSSSSVLSQPIINGLSFNEQLRILSQSILNKENNFDENSKVNRFFSTLF